VRFPRDSTAFLYNLSHAIAMGQISKSSILENAYNLGARDMWVYAKYIDLHLAGSKRNVTKSCIVIVIVVTYFFWHLLVK